MWVGPVMSSIIPVSRKCFSEQRKPQRIEDLPDEPDASELTKILIALLSVRCWLAPCLPDVPLYPQPQPSKPRPTVPAARITKADLDRAMDGASRNVQPWLPGAFAFVRTLQAAPRNHGKVDLMQGTEGVVAVKGVPNWFLAAGPDEFAKANPDELEEPWRDIAVVATLNALKFPYACDLAGVYRDDSTTYIVSSLATGGDLFSWSVQAPEPGAGREHQMRAIMVQTCSAVRRLHDLGLAHRDLSLENILLTDPGDGRARVKIIDYSMATVSRVGSGPKHGKSVYKAPEMYDSAEYDIFPCDAFALGVVLYSMAWKRYPWKSTRPGRDEAASHAGRLGVVSMNRHHRVESERLAYSDGFYRALEGLLAMEPHARMHLGEACFKSSGGVGSAVWGAGWL